MEDNHKTDKALLVIGLKRLGICLLLMFAGPTLLHIALANDEKPLYIPLLIVGIILCFLAVILLFYGINTIINSMFKSK